MSLSTLLRAAAFYTSAVLCGVSAFLLNLLALGCSWLPASARVESFFQRLIHHHAAVSFRWLAAVRVLHVEYRNWRPGAGEQCVVVANHPGLFDAFYLLARAPRAFCVFKTALGRNPVVGAVAQRAGYLSNDRSVELVRRATEKLICGATLIIFPEGTRTTAGAIGTLRPGFALIARRARVPVQLVRISSDCALFTRQQPWWQLPPVAARVVVQAGPRLDPAAYASTEALVAEVETWLRRASDSRVQLTPATAIPLTVS